MFLFGKQYSSLHAPLLSILLVCFALILQTSLSFVLVPSTRAQIQDDEVIRVNTDLVLVNVTVMDAQGKFVNGLKQADFGVMEGGQPQTVSSFTAEETPFAAAVLLDTSGSMEQRLSLGRSAAIRFLDGLRDEDVAAVYRFDTKVERLQDFSSDRDLAPGAYSIRTRGMTVLNDAIVRAADDLSRRSERRRAIVVLSDGGENRSNASPGKALERALAVGATIYTVNMSSNDGVRDLQSTGVLKEFANKSGGLYVASPGGQALRDSFSGIVAELGHQYTLAYRPSNRARDGSWRSIDVKLSR
ncbi:MAG: VWA domain-containing protein, partial [Pyrinomonadaceae bacterium]